jgi:hypothetical protein
MAPTSGFFARWSMYGKALKHHVDTLPDIADQLQSSGGSVSSSQAEQNNRNTISPKTAKTRQQLVTQCKIRRNGDVNTANIHNEERDMDWNEKRKKKLSLQRLQLSLQRLKSPR